MVSCLLLSLALVLPAMGADYDLVILNWRVMDPETRLDDVRNVGVKHGRAFSIQTYEQAIKDGLAVDLAKYLTLRWSKSRPTDAFVAIQHRGKWFYVDDRDGDSKRVFNLVYDLYNIEIASMAESGGPVLTLPVK